MAYYKDAPHQRRKVNHADQGSWDDEGTHYHHKPAGPVNRFGPELGKPVRGNRASDRPEFRDGRAFQAGGSRPERPASSRRDNRGPQARPERGPAARNPRQERPAARPAPVNRRAPKPAAMRPAPRPVEARPVEPRPLDYRDFEQRRPVPPVPPAPVAECQPNENLLSGRNPIREALKAGRDIEKLLVQRGDLSGSAREIVHMAREAHVPIQEVDKARLDAITPHHQGLLAFASAYQYATVEDMLALAQERGEAPFLILLDGITDPHNLGAIIRTAECVGAHGVIVPERRSVGLTPAAVKASAGAVEHVHVARVVNLTRTLELLQAKNIWTYAVTMDGDDYDQVDFSGGVALVIGAEGEGISRLTLEKCDRKVSLPMKGKIDSLNASVAAGVMMYRVLQSRTHQA